jgi:tetratricopeptide (TPR) repeat protein
MKKSMVMGAVLAALCGMYLSAQEAEWETVQVTTAHYEVIADAGDGEALSRELENRFAVYDRLFRFDPSRSAFPLRVRSFRNRDAYDSYISARLGGPRPGAVYLHYNQSERRELVIHRGGADEWRTLPYQAFIQYLRAFVSNPPSWIREGFAVYFSTLAASETGELKYEENLNWIETVRGLIGSPGQASGLAPGPKEIMLADKGGMLEHFQSLAWSLVSFFLNSGTKDYFRAVTESFLVLSPAAGAEENAEAVLGRISLFGSMEDLEKDYRNYIASRKTFPELIDEGQKAYAAKDRAAAELAFLRAVEQKPGHYAPYYYLGLLSYEEGSYDMAETWYLSAANNGADGALVAYALGVNAASAGRKKEAADYLRRAAAASPERYGDRVRELLRRLEQ